AKAGWSATTCRATRWSSDSRRAGRPAVAHVRRCARLAARTTTRSPAVPVPTPKRTPIRETGHPTPSRRRRRRCRRGLSLQLVGVTGRLPDAVAAHVHAALDVLDHPDPDG